MLRVHVHSLFPQEVLCVLDILRSGNREGGRGMSQRFRMAPSPSLGNGKGGPTLHCRPCRHLTSPLRSS